MPARAPGRTDILHFIAVDPAAPLPLVAQLRRQLTGLIASGQAQPGDRLPPVREVAAHLGINRNTVRAAYRCLQADGWVTLRQGRGTLVLPSTSRRPRQPPAHSPTFSIGVLVPGLNPFYTPFLQGIEETARDAPWLAWVCYTHDQPELARRFWEQLIARQVDGLIVVAHLSRSDAERGPLPPVVHVDRPDVGGYAILLDSENAGFLATQHLLEHGHRRIALLSGPLHWPNVRPCYTGYERALRAAGLAVDPDCVVEVPAFTVEAGQQAMQRLLERPDPPTAVFGSSDVLAIGAMRAIEERGLRVPQDAAVVGYNNIDLAGLVKPALTTVSAPGYEMGVAAMTMLLDLLAGRPVKKRCVTLPTRLVVRQSCGCNVQQAARCSGRQPLKSG